MSPPQSLTASLGPGSPLAAVLPYWLAVLTAVLGYLGARFTAAAPLQESLNDAFRTLMEELQSAHARAIVRASELEAEIIRQRGELRQLEQRRQSLVHFIERAGLTVPDL